MILDAVRVSLWNTKHVSRVEQKSLCSVSFKCPFSLIWVCIGNFKTIGLAVADSECVSTATTGLRVLDSLGRNGKVAHNISNVVFILLIGWCIECLSSPCDHFPLCPWSSLW